MDRSVSSLILLLSYRTVRTWNCCCRSPKTDYTYSRTYVGLL